ncbi:TPA: DUF2603 domain-containing protein [Campylobacter coli]|uniref:DUF2603 domain-containing protein n=1 Tax=Campylobacter coli TaxID=195 RepID=UPI0005765B5B|nr:DUF2603 domain-containing protein [Campylobacter coli]EJF4580573.1 DUF2603 domain-containing protein [Campylobacter coli]MPB32300.1 DUF2603 domain-containing protein [Campylobacter coli]HED4391562.1 DUF2603 domain-containing protein [Campylobacter coli]HED6006743.1 DUF2603 domain-containing protein [Campylobacter coli]HEF9123951.1 DUF2603 domain-containing protein [Campylobacter coli]
MKELEKYSNCLKRIDEFSQNLGMKKEDRAIFEMKQSENENEKCLILKNGSFDSLEPWFIMDENDQIHTLISLNSLKNILENLKQTQKENFELRLEKAIYQQIPIDFSDVWIVAMDEIKRKAQEGVMEISIDLEKLLADIKKEHPNLFVDMQAMVERVKNNERL